MSSSPMPMIRSALFVPASSERFLRAAIRSGADAVILDLEDGVADASRDVAREMAGNFILRQPEDGVLSVLVRINPLTAGQLDMDLDAVVQPSLDGVLLPKVDGPRDIAELDRQLSWYEGRHRIPHGTVRIWPLLETATAIARVAEIAVASPRVAHLGGAIAHGGDLARSLGLGPDGDGLESLYLRSRVLVEARAAGIANPITGLYTDVDDLSGLESFAVLGRRLGYDGMMVIHPAHVPIVNRVFSPSEAALDEAHRILAAIDGAALAGSGAVRLDGRMIDAAMATTARSLIARDADARAKLAQSGSDDT